MVNAMYNSMVNNDYNIKLTNVMLGDTKGVKYEFINSNGELIGKFTTFEWWDGKYISHLEVTKKYRGNGYSYKLLDYATKQLECTAISVRKDNIVAKHIYDKYGFLIIDEDKELYYMYLYKS